MRFKRIRIENFGPFKQPAVIDFKDRDGVSIVWGRNGRGKTTILNAFNFVLNKTVKDRSGETNNFISFINESGRDEGKFSYKVTLDLEENGKNYRIVRSLSKLPSVDIPKTDNDVRINLEVNEDGNIISTADAEHFVSSIMTKEVSRFFLFDGELLTEYEELLNESSTTGGSIKKSIEQILGMPILTYGEIDANSAAANIATAARKVAQNEDTVKQYTKKVEEKTESLNYQIEELNRLIEQRDAAIEEKNKYEQLASETQKLREAFEKKQGIIEKMNYQEEIYTTEKKEISAILNDSLKWMVFPIIDTKHNVVKQQITNLRNKERESKGQEKVIEFIQRAIDESSCPVCDHEIDHSELELLKQKIEQYKMQNEGLTDEEKQKLYTLTKTDLIYDKNTDKYDRAKEINDRYSKYVSARTRYSDLQQNDLKEVDYDIEEYKKSASGSDELEAIEYYNKATADALQIAILNQGIEEANKVIEQTNNDITRLNRTIISKSQNKDVVLANKKVEFANNIAAIFGEGIDLYRDKLSRDVEKDATEIFMAMNTEADYGGLKINENYGLTIVRKSDGKPVIKRSAGWEHMVAFALIGALHKNAPFDGPVIMDSPFYRLDSTNKASMVKALPLIANQVLMLPYPGEINEVTTRNDLKGDIIQELEIARISSNESIIKELRNNE